MRYHIKSKSITWSILLGFSTFLLFAFSQTAFTGDTAEKLADRVHDRIYGHYHTDYPGILQLEVRANQDGRVELQGQVETLYDKYRIHNIVTRVEGVNSITNQLIIETEPLPDEEIEKNIETAIKRNSAIVEPQRIDVEVNNGLVLLSGKVSFNREKEMAETIASWKQGVKGIENKLEVLPPGKALSDENLEQILGQILDYQFPTEDKVSFDVENGRVVLKGTTSNLWTKQAIEDEFRDVMGIRDVLNNLKLKEYAGS